MSPAAAILPREHIDRWREFWRTRELLQRSRGNVVSVGDEWATVRDGEGRLLEMFINEHTPEEIDRRLASINQQQGNQREFARND